MRVYSQFADWENVIRNDPQNGGSVAPTEITREQWHRELIEGVFVPSPLKSKVSQRARE